MSFFTIFPERADELGLSFNTRSQVRFLPYHTSTQNFSIHNGRSLNSKAPFFALMGRRLRVIAVDEVPLNRRRCGCNSRPVNFPNCPNGPEALSIMNYKFFVQNKTRTPQTQPIPGREAEMIQGRSGGYMFKAGLWQTLRRCLLIGTAQSTYYAGKQELTHEFVDVLEQAIAENPERVAAEIVYASDGRAINNSAPIFALVLLSMGAAPEAKQAFQKIFPKVVRTGSHFYEWLSYTKSVRGFGKMVRAAGQRWLARENVKELAYQLLKYQQGQ